APTQTAACADPGRRPRSAECASTSPLCDVILFVVHPPQPPGCRPVGKIGTVRKILRFGQLRRYAFSRPTARKAELAMAIPTRDPVVRYLLLHASTLRLPGTRAAERLDQHARAIELLANYVRGLAEDDERLLQLGTLAVRGGEFVPGPATEHALGQFTGAT